MLRALETLGQASLGAGDLTGAGQYAMEALEADPLRESAVRLLMRARVAAGNPAEALRVYETARQRIRNQLGTHPSAATERLASEVRGDPNGDILTPREREVAALLAEGLTNREIADALVISPQTAETHVKHILNRLGYSSRAQVASWATTRNLQRRG